MLAGLLGVGHYLGIYFLALLLALGSIFAVYRIAHAHGRTPVQTLILAGVIVSLFFNALVFLFFSVFFREQYTTLFYLLGTLTEGDSVKIGISGGLIVAGLGVTWLLGPGTELAHPG